MSQLLKQDLELLEAALIGFQYRRTEVEQRIADLRHKISGQPSASAATPSGVSSSAATGRKMSASARQRIALAQKKRWASYKAQNGKSAAPKRKKRVLSAAGRARIVAATKKRWAEFRKAHQGK